MHARLQLFMETRPDYKFGTLTLMVLIAEGSKKVWPYDDRWYGNLEECPKEYKDQIMAKINTQILNRPLELE